MFRPCRLAIANARLSRPRSARRGYKVAACHHARPQIGAGPVGDVHRHRVAPRPWCDMRTCSWLWLHRSARAGASGSLAEAQAQLVTITWIGRRSAKSLAAITHELNQPLERFCNAEAGEMCSSRHGVARELRTSSPTSRRIDLRAADIIRGCAPARKKVRQPAVDIRR